MIPRVAPVVRRLSKPLLFLLAAWPAFGQGTAFLYQGRLNSSGAPLNGFYDLQFAVYDASSGGNQQGPTLTNSATGISNGLFTVSLDFGNVYPGSARWLQIGVRTNGVGAFTTLSPRQSLAPTPYAVTATGVPAGAITGPMLAPGAVTTDKIAAGAVKSTQIDDGGAGSYQVFQEAIQNAGGDMTLGFGDLSPVVPTNGAPPTLTLTINTASFGTVLGFTATEEISQPYAVVVEASSPKVVTPDSQVGQPGQLTFTRNGRSTTFSGTVTACTLSGSSAGGGFLYAIKIESLLAYLALNSDYRIFQNLSPVDTATTIYQTASGGTPVNNLTGSYSVYENLIQYNETALNFFSRLLEYEGIFYYFNQGSSPPALTLADSTSAYPTSPNSPFVYYGNAPTSIPAGVEYIRSFQQAVHQSTLKSTVNSYNFTTPSSSLFATTINSEGTGEQYEFGSKGNTPAYNTRLSAILAARQNIQRAMLAGASTAPDLRAGYVFGLTDSSGAGLGSNYLVTAIHHAGFVRVTNGVSSFFYGNQFQAIPASLLFRPALRAVRPQASPSTAVVTGPAGTTPPVYVDRYGRVKVQFHWDRYGKMNDLSSAWLRVLNPAAGSTHSVLFLPHIGDEVMVSFIEGDPDQPFVLGALYNAVNNPPYSLPASKTTSTIRSVGTDGAVNEMRFDDTAGSQLLSVLAAKDLELRAAGVFNLFDTNGVTINAGLTLTNLVGGQTIIGSSATSSTNIAITFPKTFNTPPKVLATTSNDPNWNNVNDTFVAAIRSVTTTGCILNIVRVDAATGWSQNLRVNWWAWE